LRQGVHASIMPRNSRIIVSASGLIPPELATALIDQPPLAITPFLRPVRLARMALDDSELAVWPERLYPEWRCKTSAAAPRNRASSASVVTTTRGPIPANNCELSSRSTRGPNFDHEVVRSPVRRIMSGERAVVINRSPCPSEVAWRLRASMALLS